MVRQQKRKITISVPQDESTAVVEAAQKLGVSVTMVLRMLIRESLMHNPIVLKEAT